MKRNILFSRRQYEVAIAQARAIRNITAFRERILQRYQLSSSEWQALGYIAAKTEQGGTRVGDIALALDVKSVYVTSLLRKLERKQLVRAKTATQDRRVRMVTTTPKGKAVADSLEADFIEQSAAQLTKVSQTQLKHFLAVLDLLAEKST